MGNSLRDELLKAGLVTEEQADRASHRRGEGGARAGKGARRGKKRARRRKSSGAGGPERTREERSATQTRPAARKREKRGEDPARKQRRERIHALVLEQRLDNEAGEVAHHFVKRGRVKRLWVTGEQHRGLADGTLAITVAKGRHHVVPAETAGAVLDVDPEWFVHWVSPEPAPAPDPDDPYAEFPVPDDLVW